MKELTFGKITNDIFEKMIYPNLGAFRQEVLVGPTPGVDCCIVKIASNVVLVATTDPLTFIPELGAEDSAWLSVQLVASDIATSGFRPQYAMFDLNLPSTLGDTRLENYWKGISKNCEELGTAIVGGHTGSFEGLDSTVVGGGSMFSIGSINRYVSSKDAMLGDDIILTKGAAIATTGILARVFPETIRRNLGEATLQEALGYFSQITVVKDALAASQVGVRLDGVGAMHDATEGGVLSAIYELASASSLGASIDIQSIDIAQATSEICNMFKIDPLVSLSEGSLVIASNPANSKKIIASLSASGTQGKIVGKFVDADFGISFQKSDGKKENINHNVKDPYWNAYYEAKKRGWK